MDLFEDGTATLGGAPLNVVLHANQLLRIISDRSCGIIVSATGVDEWGKAIRSKLLSEGMSLTHLAENSAPTGTALVFAQGNDVEFKISEDVAWDSLIEGEAEIELAKRCSAVVFGSLAQRARTSRQMIRSFVGAVNGIRLYDVNLRTNTTDGRPGYTPEILDSSCRLATIVKANIRELIEVTKILGIGSPQRLDSEETDVLELMECFRKHYSLHSVVVTRGDRGALFCSSTEQFVLESPPVALEHVYPVGAGDAFSAGLLFGLSCGWQNSEALQLAEKMGFWVAQHVSATVPLSPEIRAFVQLKFKAMTAARQKTGRPINALD